MREAAVVEAFTEWLRQAGWDVKVEVDDADVVAERNGYRLVAEVKGGTAAPGLDVDTGYGQLLRRMREDPSTRYALVVPESAGDAATRVPDHVLQQLRVGVFCVSEDGDVGHVAGPAVADRRVAGMGIATPADASAGHPVERFRAQLEAVPHQVYPDQLVPVARRYIQGVAAFPASRGLYAECGWDHRVPPPFPFGGLMLVGNHLDSEAAYLERLASGRAHGDPCPDAPKMRFWVMLYALLDRAGIDRDRIFITNVHPALLRGDNPVGVVKTTPEWKAVCSELLRQQVATMRPAMIAAMGGPAQRFIGEMFGVSWGAVPDRSETELDGHRLTVAAIKHPSAAQSTAAAEATARLLREATIN